MASKLTPPGMKDSQPYADRSPESSLKSQYGSYRTRSLCERAAACLLHFAPAFTLTSSGDILYEKLPFYLLSFALEIQLHISIGVQTLMVCSNNRLCKELGGCPFFEAPNDKFVSLVTVCSA